MIEPSKDPLNHRIIWPINLRTIKCPACGRVDRWEPVEFNEESYPRIFAFCDCGAGELAFDFQVGYYPSKHKNPA
jgi:hypothetical protein